MIDTHAHLIAPYFTVEETAAVLAAAPDMHIMCVTELPSRDIANVQHNLAHRHPRMHYALGLHPERAVDVWINHGLTGVDRELRILARALDAFGAQNVACIGECGLDFSPHVVQQSDELRCMQRYVLQRQMAFSRTYDLPLNLHSRQAGRHVLDELIAEAANAARSLRFLLHAFDAKPATVRRAIALGAYFSIAPSVIREPHLQRLLELVPRDRIVLESDAPALGPVRGMPCTPSDITIAVAAIAEAWQISRDEVVRITDRNTRALFGERVAR